MGSTTPTRTRPRLLQLLALSCVVSVASAESATIYSMPRIEPWASPYLMSLTITTLDGNTVVANSQVLPLTAHEGLNQSARAKGDVVVTGNMVSADTSNYVNLTGGNTVTYLCCDTMNNSNIDQNMVMNTVMTSQPQAILLYSLAGNCCGLLGSDLSYNSIFTMVDSGDAENTLNWTTSGSGSLKATILGNQTTAPDNQDSTTGTNNSAVAMSILYSITGLITLLFLIIIATGAIRAHRYPERYGPRAGYGGRPRQSRAKGLARAVLETLPIVKFGDPTPAKPDPALELESQATRTSNDASMGTRLSAIAEEPQPHQVKSRDAQALGSVDEMDAEVAQGATRAAGAVGSASTTHEDENLGCSICTEDFTVGEDVRVLPCDHKFHPPCIDPWLINVSGTCPLCRLDLRPQEERDRDHTVTADDLLQLPPPLEMEGNESSNENGQESNDQGAASTQRSRRASRVLDLHRLRHASVEERIEILRRHRSQQQQQAPQSPEGDSEERSRRARLADRLKEKFRIRTRTQSSDHEPGV